MSNSWLRHFNLFYTETHFSNQGLQGSPACFYLCCNALFVGMNQASRLRQVQNAAARNPQERTHHPCFSLPPLAPCPLPLNLLTGLLLSTSLTSYRSTTSWPPWLNLTSRVLSLQNNAEFGDTVSCPSYCSCTFICMHRAALWQTRCLQIARCNCSGFGLDCLCNNLLLVFTLYINTWVYLEKPLVTSPLLAAQKTYV